ncbi:YibE/F family protein [Anaerophilus nitritogenes]|uniref:YibE/F family protein n=1 Tax=Anaerophilus nitritogenes TaxID=2498136 RepID=UPI00101CB773|nr:YibE/F family protein [Anaerophilus nitritogenes]
MKKICKVFIFTYVFLFLIFFNFSYGNNINSQTQIRTTGIITQIQQSTQNGGNIYTIEAKLKKDPYKDQLITLTHIPIEGTASSVELKKGMSVIINLQLSDGQITQAHFFDVDRRDSLKILGLTFLILLVIFGGFKGIRAAFSLIFTLLSIIFCLIPLILNEVNPILAAIITSSIAIFINFIIIIGFNKKSFCAIISTIGGTIMSGIFAFYFGNLMALTGISDEYIQTFIGYTDLSIDCRGLLFSGVIIGTIGAVMDISMSITSFIFEMKERYPKTSSSSLLKSGINVGKDIMSTMANTLILAYAGTSLPLFLFFTTMNVPFLDAINMEFISEEIFRSLCGSIGLILTIPLSSFIASIKA